MKLINVMLPVLLASGSAAAIGAPVYLQCAYTYKEKEHSLAVTLNEDEGSATIVAAREFVSAEPDDEAHRDAQAKVAKDFADSFTVNLTDKKD